jgi:hypothetical protein
VSRAGVSAGAGSATRPAAKQVATKNNETASDVEQLQEGDAEEERRPAAEQARRRPASLRHPAVDDDEQRQRRQAEQRAGRGLRPEHAAVDEREHEQDRAGDDGQPAEDAGNRDPPPAASQRDGDHAGRGQQQLRQ